MHRPSEPVDPRSHHATPNNRAKQPRFRSETLLAGGRQAVIEHRGEQYVLRLTASGKLILTK